MQRSGQSAMIYLLGMVIASIAIFSPSISNALSRTGCGAVLTTTIKDENQVFLTGSLTYVEIPGALIQVTVPKGKKRCVTLRFSAFASCSATVFNDRCQIEALRSGNSFSGLMSPQKANLSFVAEDPNYSAHEFTWVATTDETTKVHLRAKVATIATVFSIDAWTMEVQVSEAIP